MRSLGIALLVAVPAAVWANGRMPATNGVFFGAGDNQSIYVRTTFGLLISHDDGCHFNWVCEQAIGYNGSFDPKYVIAKDGTIFATTFSGLRVSHDGGCSFPSATAGLPIGDPNRIADRWIDALDIGPTGEIWVGTSDNGLANDVYFSTDGGDTFSHRGMQSPTIFWKSVKIAPADPKRVYISGYQVAGTLADGGAMSPTAHFLHSDDDGVTWSESAMAGVMFGSTPIVYAVAVDPTNKDIVFMMSLAANPPNGDRLYRSIDAGVTFTEVLASAQPILDVVIRDANTVAVAAGAGGSYISTTGGASFTPMANAPQLGCLGQRGDGQLIGCGANWSPDYKAVDRSTDAATWSKVFRFVELEGPLHCPAGTAEQDTCAPLWPGLRDQFGATGSTCGFAPDIVEPAKKSGGCCDAGDGGPTGMLIALGIGGLVLRRRRS